MRNPDSVLETVQTSFKTIHPSLQDIKEYLLYYYYSAILLGIFNAVLVPAEGEAPELSTWFGTGEMRSVIITFEPKPRGV